MASGIVCEMPPPPLSSTQNEENAINNISNVGDSAALADNDPNTNAQIKRDQAAAEAAKQAAIDATRKALEVKQFQAKRLEREAFEAEMRADDAAAGLPTRLRYIDLSKIMWGAPSVSKAKELSASEKKAQAKAVRAAAIAAAKSGQEVEKTVSFGPSVFMNWGNMKFSSLRTRFTSKRRVPFDPSNGYLSVWLDATKPAKINIALNDDADDPSLDKVQAAAIMQEQEEELVKLRYIQDTAIDHVTAFSDVLLGVVLTREAVEGCMCGLLSASKKAPGKYALGMKWTPPNPDPKKISSQIVNVTGIDRNDAGTVTKVHFQPGDCTTVPRQSYLIPDITLAHSLWFKKGKGQSWGFNSSLHRTPCYPPRPRKSVDAVKSTIDDAAMLIPEAMGVPVGALHQNEELLKVQAVGDVSSSDEEEEEEDDNGAGVSDVVPISSSSARKRGGGGGSKSSVAVDAAVGAKKKRGRRSADM